MNISSVSSSQMFQQQMNSTSRSSSLTSDQKALIKDTLSQYDADSLSADDATAIVKTFQDAGIEPSSALESAMSTSGFDAKEVGDLAGVGQAGGGSRPMGGPPPPPSKDELSTISDLLESLLSDEEDTTSTSSTTTSSSPYDDTSFTAFNSILDYTNQIVNLKDDAKDDVMNILDKYSSNDSQQDTQASTVDSLNKILNKSENYNRISFYA